MIRAALPALALTLFALAAVDPAVGQGFKPGPKPKVVKPRASLATEVDSVPAVAISADGKLGLAHIATGGSKNVQLWDLAGKKKLHAFEVGALSYLAPAFSPDSKRFAISNQNRSYVSLREVSSGKELRQLLAPTRPSFFMPMGMTFNKAGDLLIAGVGKDVVGWEPDSGEVKLTLKGPSELTAVSNPFGGGKQLATASEDGKIRFWDLDQRKELRTLAPGDKWQKLVVAADGKRVAGYGGLGRVQVLDAATGKKLSESDMVPGLAAEVRLLPDGRSLVFADPSGNIRVMNMMTGATTHMLQGHTKTTAGLALTPDGSTLLSGSADQTLKLWTLKPLP